MCACSIKLHVLFATASELLWKGAALWRTYKKFIGIGSQAVGQHELLRHCKGKKYAKVIPRSIQPGMSSRRWEVIPVQAKSTCVQHDELHLNARPGSREESSTVCALLLMLLCHTWEAGCWARYTFALTVYGCSSTPQKIHRNNEDREGERVQKKVTSISREWKISHDLKLQQLSLFSSLTKS